MRCLSRVWNVLELSLSRYRDPLWSPSVMIPPDTRTLFVQCTCEETESEAALSDWFLFTSGSVLADEELMVYTCTDADFKQFPYEKSSVHFKTVKQIWVFVCISSYVCKICASLGFVFLCVWERGTMCRRMYHAVCWQSCEYCSKFKCSSEGLAWDCILYLFIQHRLWFIHFVIHFKQLD